MNYLVVGGGSAAGQSAIRAIRSSDTEAHIYATTSRSAEKASPIEGADETLYDINLFEKDTAAKLAMGMAEVKLRAIFYTPAFGPVGFPVSEATAEQIAEAKAFCFDPMVALTESLKPELTIGYSAFFHKPHLLSFYGALAYVKRDMEKLALENPKQYRMLRAGSFLSKATRGISLLLQRQLKKGELKGEAKNMYEQFQASGKKFGDFFFEYIFAQEEKNVTGFDTPYRPTTEEDLEVLAKRILTQETKPIVCSMGAWHWEEDTMPELPAELSGKL